MSLLEFYVDKQFLRTQEMSFKIPADSLKTYHLDVDIPLEFEDEMYYIAKLAPIRVANEPYYQVKANASWYRLGERKYIGTFSLIGVTPEVGLNEIMVAAQAAGLDWQYRGVSASTTLYSLEAEDASYLDLILQWAKICQCELAFDTRSRAVTMTEVIGANFGLSFQYRRNLKEIERVETPPTVTRLYPYGRLDLTIAGLNSGLEYLEDYSYYTNKGLTLPQAQAGYQKDYTFQDDTFVDERSLYNYAVNQMAIMAQPSVSYTAKVVDLSRITGYAESQFGLGDFVWVEDELLGISVEARVVRYVRYPYEPHRNEVELAFAPVALPDPGVKQTRQDNKNWELFHRTNEDTVRYATVARSVLHRLPLLAHTDAEWIVEYSLNGYCEESGTLILTFINDHTGEAVLPEFNIPVTAGNPVVFNWALASELVPIDTYQIVVRTEMAGSSGRVLIQPNQSHFWVFCRGMVEGSNPVYTDSIRYDYTGSKQTFIVPDDVTEIQIECHGASGAGAGSGVGGCKVVAVFPVTAGDPYAVYVGEVGDTPQGGYPNGGKGVTSNNQGAGGGGSSSMTLDVGGTFDSMFAASIIVAGASGGKGSNDISIRIPGRGSFLGGIYPTGSDAEGAPGSGATQLLPGQGWNGAEDGDTLGQGYGGRGASLGATLHSEGGGGAGGWHGGGAGHYDGNSRGGGGGSGWADPYLAYDLEYEDGENTGNGYIIVSWAAPVYPD